MPIVVRRKKAQDPKNREEQIRKRLEELRKRNRRTPAPGAGMGLLKPSAGMLTGGQAKLDRNKNNRIDAQDFKILRAEKAKGRGKGLQDEKMKPGKMMKANKGDMANKKNFKGFSKVFEGPQDKGRVATISGKKPSLRADSKASKAARLALKAAKATRLGKIAASVAVAGLAAKEFLKRKMEKKKDKPQKKMGGGMMMQRPMGYKKGSKKEMEIKKFVKKHGTFPYVKPKKKMGGGMMKKVPGYKKGSLNQGTFSIGPFKPKPGGSKPSLDDYDQMKRKRKLMGGGMMMRPVPMGMKSGKSVKVKCKLGRNKPTKMY